MKPIVTIGLVTYNRCEDLRVAINSVLNQSLNNWRLIISDDFSVDATEAISMEFVRFDSRITYVKHSKLGMTGNFNWVLANANTKYFMWLCDDDYIEDNYLENNIFELENDHDLICSAGLTKSFHKGASIKKVEMVFQLEMRNRVERIVSYVRSVDKNIYLFGVFRHEKIKYSRIPDVYCSDLIWIAEITLSGKMKVIPTTSIYYSETGISSSTESLIEYFKPMKMNPYRIYRSELISKIIFNKNLNILEKFVVVLKVYWILHEKYLQYPIEKKLRGFLKVRTRFYSILR